MLETFDKTKQFRRNQVKSQSHPKNMNLAASWYIAMPAKKLKQKPQAIELFSQPLVAWRNQQGHPVIMERFCAHMGASLALGELREGCLQCPFHHWQFDSTGECVSIPEIDKIPPTARQKTYVTKEKYGFIWVWYGTETPLFPLPEFPPAESQKQHYMHLYFPFKVETTARRVLENVYDAVHLTQLHGLKTNEPIQVTLLAEQDLNQRTQRSIEKEVGFGVIMNVSTPKWLGSGSEYCRLQFESWPSGHITKTFLNGQEKLTAMATVTPISENRVILHTLHEVRKTGNFLLDLICYLGFGVYGVIKVFDDVPIWNTLKLDGGGAYVSTDRELLKFREFYQSWVDRVE